MQNVIATAKLQNPFEMKMEPVLSFFSFRVFLVIIICFSTRSANAYVYPTMDMGGSDSLGGFGASGGNSHLGDHDNPWGAGMTPNDWFMLGGRSQPPQCVPIPKNLTLCNDIRYDKMRLPNLLDHDTLNEVVDQAASWVGLVSIKCHPDSQLFLCSLFSPVCLDRLIYPCRSICTAVKAGCEQRMLAYGFAWPEMLNCDKFPLDNDLCIKPQAHMQPVDNSCDACQQSHTFEGIMDNFCRAGLVVRAKVGDKKRRGDGSLELVLTKSKVYKYGSGGAGRGAGRRRHRSSIGKKEPIHIFLENGNTCDCPVLSSMTKKDSFLIMANRVEDRWVISFIMKKPKKSRDFRRAVKKFNDNPCSKAVEFMTEKQKIIGGAGSGKSGSKDSSSKSGRSKNSEGRQTRNQRNSRKRQRQNQLERRLKQRAEKRRQQQQTSTAPSQQ